MINATEETSRAMLLLSQTLLATRWTHRPGWCTLRHCSCRPKTLARARTRAKRSSEMNQAREPNLLLTRRRHCENEYYGTKLCFYSRSLIPRPWTKRPWGNKTKRYSRRTLYIQREVGRDTKRYRGEVHSSRQKAQESSCPRIRLLPLLFRNGLDRLLLRVGQLALRTSPHFVLLDDVDQVLDRLFKEMLRLTMINVRRDFDAARVCVRSITDE